MGSTRQSDTYKGVVRVIDELSGDKLCVATVNNKGYLNYVKGGKDSRAGAFNIYVKDKETCKADCDILKHNLINYLRHKSYDTDIDTRGESIFSLINNNDQSCVIIDPKESLFYRRIVCENKSSVKHTSTMEAEFGKDTIRFGLRTPVNVVDSIVPDESAPNHKDMYHYVSNMINFVDLDIVCNQSKGSNTMSGKLQFRYHGKGNNDCIGDIPEFTRNTTFVWASSKDFEKAYTWLDSTIDELWKHIITSVSLVLELDRISIMPDNNTADICVITDTRLNRSLNMKVAVLASMVEHGLRVDLSHTEKKCGTAGNKSLQDNRFNDIMVELKRLSNQQNGSEEGFHVEKVDSYKADVTDIYSVDVALDSNWKSCLIHGVNSNITDRFYKGDLEMLKKYGNLNIKYVD